MKSSVLLLVMLFYSVFGFSNDGRLRNAYLTEKGNKKIDAALEYACSLAPSDSVLAIRILQESLKEASLSHYQNGQIKAYSYWGWYYFEKLHNRMRAIPLFKKAKELAKVYKNDRELFSAYRRLTDVYVFTGDFIGAIELLKEAEKVAKETNNQRYLLSIYIASISCYAGIGDFAQADTLFKESLKQIPISKNQEEVWYLYNIMADVKRQERKPKESLYYLNKSIEIGTKIKAYYNVLNLQSKVDLLIRFNRIKEAEDLCKSIRKEMETMPAYAFVGSNNKSFSMIYIAKKDYDKALAYALLAYKEITATGNENNLIEVDTLLSSIYEKLGNHRQALYYLKEYNTLYGKILLNDKIRNFHTIQYRIGLERKQFEINHAEQSKRVYVFLSLGLVIVLVLMVVVFVIKQKNNQLNVKLLDESAKNEEQKLTKIQFEMESKARELTILAMAADQKTVLWQSIQQKLKDKMNEIACVSEKDMKDVLKIIDQNTESNDEWGTFKVHFESVHPQFFTTLSQLMPSLTPLELRQCAYIKINLSPKQVGNLLNITPDSVKKARMRIKKKLNLSPEDSLTKFIANIQEGVTLKI
jgi:tetratricopeptide (TPR) repeat protein